MQNVEPEGSRRAKRGIYGKAKIRSDSGCFKYIREMLYCSVAANLPSLPCLLQQ